MSPRRIRVSGARADFVTPRGWPTPTDQWVRSNVFWQPPDGWTPLTGLRPAPANWRFWVPNKEWEAAGEQYFRPATNWWRAANYAAAGFIAANLAAWMLQIPTLRWAGIACAAVGVACLIAFSVKKRRLSRVLFAKTTEAAARLRTERMTRAYQRYLLDVS